MRKPQLVMSIFKTANVSKNHFKELKNNLRCRMSIFLADREKDNQRELEANFINVLEKWGIENTDSLSGVIFMLRMRILVFAILPVISIIFCIFSPSMFNFIVSILLIIPCLFGILTSLWRIWVLKKAHFVPFSHWILGGFGFWI